MMNETARQFIRHVLYEDLKSFKQGVSGVSSYAGSYYDNPTFEGEVQNRASARQIKKIWWKNADHAFFKQLIKIHWLAENVTNNPGLVKQLLSPQMRKNEIACMGYTSPSDVVDPVWADIGIVIDGVVTLAANNMDTLYSGYFSQLTPDIKRKYAASGVPRRATVFNKKLAKDYILDAASFKQASRHSDASENELIVDNWEPVGFVLSGVKRDELQQRALDDAAEGDPVVDAMLEKGLIVMTNEDKQVIDLYKERFNYLV